jgi:hypothetical protein
VRTSSPTERPYETDPRGNGTTSFDKGHGLVDVMAALGQL